jgi:16S rRNA (guanine966-N2)-methyltransferase
VSRAQGLGLRVISGEARGRRLKVPVDDSIRPTADRTKETLFQMIDREIQEARVLDLFAGTGNLGIEALSRGARQVLFVDKASGAVAIIKENLSLVDFHRRSEVWQEDVFSALIRLKRIGRQFDLVFSDPPYDRQLTERPLHLLAHGNLVEEAGLVVVEHHRKDRLPERAGTLRRSDERRFGDTVLTFYRQKAKT